MDQIVQLLGIFRSPTDPMSIGVVRVNNHVR